MADSVKATSNVIWQTLERFGAQGISFIISIVLARILEPTVYGIVALVNVFTVILDVFVDSGLGNALIQKKDTDDLDFSSVFHFNMTLSICLYAVMFIAAPFIAAFYKTSDLTPIVRVMSLSLIISGVKNIQIAYVSRNLQFKKFFFATIGGTIASAVVGITMAYKGFGVWGLIAQNLLNNIIDTAVLWLTVKWHPKFIFSWQRLKNLINYGWKILVSNLLDAFFNQIQQIIIGKTYSKEDLAFYDKGLLLPCMISSNITTSIDNVLFPTLSSVQDQPSDVKAITKRTIKTNTYIVMPLMIGLAVCAEPLVRIILTDKWLPCVTYMRIFCLLYSFSSVATVNLNAIKALGRSDYLLKLNFIQKTTGLIILSISMWFGVMAIACGLLITYIIYQIITAWPNRKLINYNYLEQIKDILPNIGLSITMGGIVFGITFLHLSDIYTLIIQIPLGIIVYIITSKVFKIDSYEYTKKILKQLLQKKTRNQ